MTELKILFDTNIFYACEDVRIGRKHPNTDVATELKELALRMRCRLYLHPATERDIKASSSAAMVETTMIKFRQWSRLAEAPVAESLIQRAGYESELSSNDANDLAMLAALDNHAVDLLVTEDTKFIDHASVAGLGNQVLTIQGAIDYLRRLHGDPVQLPSVESRDAYELNPEDPIFESLQSDYPGFREWWIKACREHRPCRTIESPSGQLEALAVLNIEREQLFGLTGKVVKLCTFKVAPEAMGTKRGELILRAVFEYCRAEAADSIFVTVFEHHAGLIRLLELFGFVAIEELTDIGELIYVKHWSPSAPPSSYTPLEYNRLFGPGAVLVDKACVIPVQPQWYDTLFPEIQQQFRLFGEASSGNAMLKAYLCNASTRKMTQGDLALFYRSHDHQSVLCIGVVEETLVSQDSTEIRRFVSTRTVYTDQEIVNLCAAGEVLAVLFRFERSLPEPWSLEQLKNNHVLNAPPQSVQHVEDERGISWLRNQLGDPR